MCCVLSSISDKTAILCTIICSVSLIAAELTSELGVDVSENCNPTSKVGALITDAPLSENVTPVELGASAFLLQTVEFIDGNLTSLPSKFPRKVTDPICVDCLYNSGREPFMSDCEVKQGKTYPPKSLNISITTTNGPFGTLTSEFKESKANGLTFMGDGDLTRNGLLCAIFLVHDWERKDNDLSLTYFEYTDQNHCEELISKARALANENGPGIPVWALSRSEIHTQTINCQSDKALVLKFRQAVQIYRTMQLENTVNLVQFNDIEFKFQPITEDDIYRAVLAAKIIDDDHAEGVYYVYTQCGIYRWIYLLPFICTVGFVVFLGLLAFFMSPRHTVHIPYSSQSWYAEAVRSPNEKRCLSTSESSKWRYFSRTFDQMVIVGDEESEELSFERGNIRLAARGRERTELTGNANGSGSSRPAPG